MAWKSMPTEVWELIICQVPSQSDVASIRRVSKHFQNTALRSLYRTIEIRAKDEWNLVDLSLDSLLRTLDKHPEYVNYVKNVCISAPVHQNLKYRCPHLYEGDSKYMETFQEAYEEEYEEMDHQECEKGEYSKPSQDVFLSDLRSGVLALLHCLRDNHLSSFSWQLGTCVPSELLGLSGQLLRKQNQIESLSLVTDTWCHLNNGIKQTNRTIPKPIGFTSLQSISWRGIHSRSDFSALQGALQANSKHLKTLELDLAKWMSAEFDYHYKSWNHDKSQHFQAYEDARLGALDKDALTLLHIRRTGIDECKRQMGYMGASSENRSLYDFAVWAFGPHGFPRLRVLAYGDFSYGNRYAQQNTLFRRRSSSGLNTTNFTAQLEPTSFEVVRSDR
ncbi:uncharacterized protein EAF01_003501 [Botrytis porri]|uniref:uncharacterized protein n=1 Tax=Botrytis porri TaxID=87229 RepID=UPI0019023A09|nr:uncharacterized protein EAF01_003501 [Botrytis porri]KAF7909783.1 hypothetical protein EAF01_003501 [Botrytis porri]